MCDPVFLNSKIFCLIFFTNLNRFRILDQGSLNANPPQQDNSNPSDASHINYTITTMTSIEIKNSLAWNLRYDWPFNDYFSSINLEQNDLLEWFRVVLIPPSRTKNLQAGLHYFLPVKKVPFKRYPHRANYKVSRSMPRAWPHSSSSSSTLSR